MFTRYYKIILAIFFGLLPLKSKAFETGQWNINSGIGIFGSRGILGVSADRFLTENHAISTAVGLDIIGPTVAVGYKYFDQAFNKPGSGTFWDKCLFLFECESHPYFGISLQYANGTSIEFITDSQKRTYSTSGAWLGMASLGFRDVFKNHMTFDLEITDRSLIKGGNIQQNSGQPNESDINNLNAGYRTVGVGLAIGYLF